MTYAWRYAQELITFERFDEAKPYVAHVLKLDPTYALAKTTWDELENIKTKRNRSGRHARFPAFVSDFENIDTAIKRFITDGFDKKGLLLRPGAKILTQGSCFAENLARELQRYPFQTKYIRLGEEHNSTFANAIVLRWLLEGESDADTRQVAENLASDDDQGGKPETREVYLQFLKEAEVFVFTLGVAPVFFDKTTGKFRLPRPTRTSALDLARNCNFRTTTVAENIDQMRQVIDYVRRANPNIKIVVTVSPVPLNATLEMDSAIVADCLSKSTLRVVAHELSRDPELDVIYWPSFEIVRWLASYHGVAYGAEDNLSTHVNRGIVEKIVNSFVRVFGESDILQTHSPTP